MTVRWILAFALASTFVACGVAPPSLDEGSATEGEGAAKKTQPGGGGGTGGASGGGSTPDAGKADAKVDNGLVTASPGSLSEAVSICKPQRFDVLLTDPTHECWQLAKTTTTGIWFVAPTFDVPALRNKACALTWLPSTPGCKSAPIDDLPLTCKERNALIERPYACAINPAACSTSAVRTGPAGAPAERDIHCDPPPPVGDGGIARRWVGGCSSCGVAYDGIVYGFNPFGPGEIGANAWNGSGWNNDGHSLLAPSGPFALAIGGVPNGPVMLSF